jgi:uncharacterized protein (DUF952 family)
MAGDLIYHICKKPEWAKAEADGHYRGSAQDRDDGFIHFSGAGQVVASAAKHRAGQTDLVLIAAEAGALGVALRWEASRGGALFPHCRLISRPVDQRRRSTASCQVGSSRCFIDKKALTSMTLALASCFLQIYAANNLPTGAFASPSMADHN